jgi:hypothetical protein
LRVLRVEAFAFETFRLQARGKLFETALVFGDLFFQFLRRRETELCVVFAVIALGFETLLPELFEV